MSTQQKRLNLGSGDYARAGWINVDWQEGPHTDVVHDLNVFPYPFADDSISEIEMFHCLEHLDRPFRVMKELHRILAPGAKLHIKVPHFSRGMTHAEHEHGFDVTFPTYFNPNFKTSGYYGFEFQCEKTELHWEPFFHLMAYLGYGKVSITIMRGLNAVFSFFANLSPAFCSRIWCFWVGGFNEIEFIFSKK
jgi:SAM-dependent methyltransferase